MAAVEPTLERLSKGGVAITYKPQPGAGHDTTWWPEVKDAYEAFVHEHPRVPAARCLTWETADPHRFGRAHWLQIDAIGATSNESRDLPDLNVYTRAPSADPGFRLAPGLKVDRVIKGSMAARLGLERNDLIQQSRRRHAARGCRPGRRAADVSQRHAHSDDGGARRPHDRPVGHLRARHDRVVCRTDVPAHRAGRAASICRALEIRSTSGLEASRTSRCCFHRTSSTSLKPSTSSSTADRLSTGPSKRA